MSKKQLKFLIILNLIWSILGAIADYEWLSSIPLELVPLTAICSLYPPLLMIWHLASFKSAKIPNWFTCWLIVATASYGLMAQIYFPLLMTWKGINFHDVGSMFWVAVYGSQSILLYKNTGSIKWLDFIPGVLFLLTANYTHYFQKTFVDLNLPGYPDWLKYSTVTIMLSLQAMAIIYLYYTKRKARSLS